jgi:hypothetical protein
MFLLPATALVLASVLLAGGRVQQLRELRIRAAWLLTVSVALQVLAMAILPNAARAELEAMHIGSYAVAAFVVILNLGIRGLPTIGLGGLLNATAIVANGGTMPASQTALAAAGLTNSPNGFENSAMLADPKLSFLGDTFSIPASWPLHNVFSVGDVLIVVGAVVLLHFACGSRLARISPVARMCRWF